MATGGLDVESAKHSTLNCFSTPEVEELSADVVVDGVGGLGIGEGTSSNGSSEIVNSNNGGGGVQVTCFTELLDDVTFHFQIIRPHKQIYAWIGCNSAKFGHLYAAAPTQPANAEKKLVEKLINLGYTRPKSNGSSS